MKKNEKKITDVKPVNVHSPKNRLKQETVQIPNENGLIQNVRLSFDGSALDPDLTLF